MANLYFFVTMIPVVAAHLRVAYGRYRHALAGRDEPVRVGQA